VWRLSVLASVAALAITTLAFARVAATGTLSRDGADTVLTVRNTGDEPIRCMRFTAPRDVDVEDAIGPGETRREGTAGFASRGFEIAPAAEARWEFSTRERYPDGGGGSLAVSATCETDVAAVVRGPGVRLAAGQIEVLSRVSGTILVRRRGARRFVRVTAEQEIPDGSEIDARDGTALLMVAGGQGVDEARVSGGRAVVDQDTAQTPTTTLRLSEPLACPRQRAAGSAVRRRALRVNAQGRFQIRGRYATAAALGTDWTLRDTCSTTTTVVAAGRVRVTSRSGRTAIARPGRRVVVRPR
jgi:hypothetical protein